MLRSTTFVLMIASLICGGVACRSTGNSVAVAPACETLDKASVAAVQGEQVTETVPSQSKSGDLNVTQCFYKLPTYSRSINFEITSGSNGVIEAYWNKRFRDRVPSEEEEEEREREREKKGGAESEEQREKEAHADRGPQAVAGLGDEAFWVANQMNGSLFIRRADAVYRIGIGGPEDANSRLEKATSLAKSFLEKKQ